MMGKVFRWLGLTVRKPRDRSRSRLGGNRAHKPEAPAKGIFKRISFNALRLRFRLVASDFPGIVGILDGD